MKTAASAEMRAFVTVADFVRTICASPDDLRRRDTPRDIGAAW